MERKIALSELKKAVDDAYEQFRSVNDGNVDPRITDADPSKFGIAVVLADGTTIKKGDADYAAPIGGIAKVAICSLLLGQNKPQELLEKSGNCPCSASQTCGAPVIKGAKGVRAVSMIEPVGDFDSKWNFIENRLIDLMGTAPQLDDKLYEALKADIVNDGEVDKLAAADFYLYDDAAGSIDLYRRAQSMKASAEQIAVMGATIAADGINPITKANVFDGEISKRIVGMMAAKGPHRMALAWDIMAGLPGKSSYAGLVLGVYPGVMAIAAYSPLLMPNKVSARAAQAIINITNTLDISVFDSSCLKIDTER